MGNKKAANVFTDGLIMDFNPMMTKDNSLVNALNATLTTRNGNELALLNDMGNGRVETAYLPEGYMPLGTCSLGGIIYIVSYNPLKGKCLIGSFPSPERNITSDETGDTIKTLSESAFYLNGDEYITNSVLKVILYDDILHPGDKFIVYEESGNLLNNRDYISAIGTLDDENLNNKYDINLNNEYDINLYPRYLKLSIVAIKDDGTIIDLNKTLVWNEDTDNNFRYYIYPESCVDSSGNIDLDEYRNLILSNYNVFLSKVNGRLAILAELEIVNSFEVAYDALKNSSGLWDFYFYLNWAYDTDSAESNDKINLYGIRVLYNNLDLSNYSNVKLSDDTLTYTIYSTNTEEDTDTSSAVSRSLKYGSDSELTIKTVTVNNISDYSYNTKVLVYIRNENNYTLYNIQSYTYNENVLVYTNSDGNLKTLSDVTSYEYYDNELRYISDNEETIVYNVLSYEYSSSTLTYDDDEGNSHELCNVVQNEDGTYTCSSDHVIITYPKKNNYGTNNDILLEGDNGNLINRDNIFYNPYFINTIDEKPDYEANNGITTERANDGTDNLFLLYTPFVSPLTSGILNLTIYPTMPFGVILSMGVDITIDLDLLGTGTILLTQYKYYWTEDKITLNWALSAYPEHNKSIEEVKFVFYEYGEEVKNFIENNYEYIDNYTAISTTVNNENFSDFYWNNIETTINNVKSYEYNEENNTLIYTDEEGNETTINNIINYEYDEENSTLTYTTNVSFETSNNLDNCSTLTLTTSEKSSYSGSFSESIISQLVDDGTLNNNSLYLVEICINYNNEKMIKYYRFMYTNQIFNDYYGKVDDFATIVLQDAIDIYFPTTFTAARVSDTGLSSVEYSLLSFPLILNSTIYTIEKNKSLLTVTLDESDNFIYIESANLYIEYNDNDLDIYNIIINNNTYTFCESESGSDNQLFSDSDATVKFYYFELTNTTDIKNEGMTKVEGNINENVVLLFTIDASLTNDDLTKGGGTVEIINTESTSIDNLSYYVDEEETLNLYIVYLRDGTLKLMVTSSNDIFDVGSFSTSINDLSKDDSADELYNYDISDSAEETVLSLNNIVASVNGSLNKETYFNIISTTSEKGDEENIIFSDNVLSFDYNLSSYNLLIILYDNEETVELTLTIKRLLGIDAAIAWSYSETWTVLYFWDDLNKNTANLKTIEDSALAKGGKRPLGTLRSSFSEVHEAMESLINNYDYIYLRHLKYFGSSHSFSRTHIIGIIFDDANTVDVHTNLSCTLDEDDARTLFTYCIRDSNESLHLLFFGRNALTKTTVDDNDYSDGYFYSWNDSYVIGGTIEYTTKTLRNTTFSKIFSECSTSDFTLPFDKYYKIVDESNEITKYTWSVIYYFDDYTYTIDIQINCSGTFTILCNNTKLVYGEENLYVNNLHYDANQSITVDYLLSGNVKFDDIINVLLTSNYTAYYDEENDDIIENDNLSTSSVYARINSNFIKIEYMPIENGNALGDKLYDYIENVSSASLSENTLTYYINNTSYTISNVMTYYLDGTTLYYWIYSQDKIPILISDGKLVFNLDSSNLENYYTVAPRNSNLSYDTAQIQDCIVVMKTPTV